MRETLLTCTRRAKHCQYINPHTLQCLVCDGKRVPRFGNRLVCGWKFFIPGHWRWLANSACCRASLSKSSFSDLNLFTRTSEAFRSAASSSKSPTETTGEMQLKSALSNACRWAMNLKGQVRSRNSPKRFE